jgi:hypothetical protein
MALLAISLSFCSTAQESLPTARGILQLSETAQIEFVNRTMDLAFPDDRGDQMTMLIINHSSLVLPLIEGKIEDHLRAASSTERFIDIASEMIAYAGDQESLRAISKLITLDESRFVPLVKRTLDNAGNWRNPFNVAYQGLEIGDKAISQFAMAWAEGALSSSRMQRAWAEAMLDRYGRLPGDPEWTNDPIASRLKGGASAELRQNIVRFTAEEQRKREGR